MLYNQYQIRHKIVLLLGWRTQPCNGWGTSSPSCLRKAGFKPFLFSLQKPQFVMILRCPVLVERQLNQQHNTQQQTLPLLPPEPQVSNCFWASRSGCRKEEEVHCVVAWLENSALQWLGHKQPWLCGQSWL